MSHVECYVSPFHFRCKDCSLTAGERFRARLSADITSLTVSSFPRHHVDELYNRYDAHEQSASRICFYVLIIQHCTIRKRHPVEDKSGARTCLCVLCARVCARVWLGVCACGICASACIFVRTAILKSLVIEIVPADWKLANS